MAKGGGDWMKKREERRRERRSKQGRPRIVESQENAGPPRGGPPADEWVREVMQYSALGPSERGKRWQERMQPEEKARILQEHYSEWADHDLRELTHMVKENHPDIRQPLERLRKRWISGELL